MRAAIEAIGRLAQAAHEHGARDIIAIATSAVRDARNREAFLRQVRQETGIEIQIIDGEREAYLTYRGATLGISVTDGAIVCDLGGGSAELIYADSTGMKWAVSEALGSGRLSERFIRDDPPPPDQVDAVRAHVTGVLERLPEATIKALILTGGTATHLGWLAGKDGAVQDVSMADIDRVLEYVTSRPAADVVAEYGVKPERAQVLPAGIAAVKAIASFYRPERIAITRRGIREGVLLAAAEEPERGSATIDR